MRPSDSPFWCEKIPADMEMSPKPAFNGKLRLCIPLARSELELDEMAF